MAQILLNRTLSYSKNFFITKNQSTLLIKSSQIIYKPIIIRSIQSCSWQTPNHTNHTVIIKNFKFFKGIIKFYFLRYD